LYIDLDGHGDRKRKSIAESGKPTLVSRTRWKSGCGRTYSLSIRPGETKTQVIELAGLTLKLVISMPGLYRRAV
jgi:hypothetical protein